MTAVRSFFLVLALPALGALSGCGAPARLYEQPIAIDAALQERIAAYDRLPRPKALVASNDAVSGYQHHLGPVPGQRHLHHDGGDPNQYVRAALAQCQAKAAQPCQVLKIDERWFAEAYQVFARASRQALLDMSLPRKFLILPNYCCYGEEAKDWQIAQPTRMRTRAEGYHAPTPVALDGIATIRTGALASLLRHGRITLIDARGFLDVPLQTIPNAYLLDWGGTGDEDTPEREAVLRAAMAKAMRQIAPDLAAPVAVTCESSQCWMSIHALMRLQTIGYTNLLWYRGGIKAWSEAGLPTLQAVPFATAWSR